MYHGSGMFASCLLMYLLPIIGLAFSYEVIYNNHIINERRNDES